ncbi:MAG: PAS domain-containing protein, partial [Rhodocyclaceae bacterium]|nr:PAS domain-containing protein [Rhodocyclaceae bacterium]
MAEPTLTEHLLAALREGAPVFVIRTGGDGLIREASPFAEGLAGRSLAGVPAADVFVHFGSPDALQAMLREPARGRLLHAATQEGLPFELYVDVIVGEGETLLVGRPDVLAMLRERRRFIDLQSQFQHTARASLKQSYMQLEQSERRHQLILDAAGDGIMGMDAQGRLTYANAAARRLLGLPRDEPRASEEHAVWLHGAEGAACGPDCPVLAAGSPGGGNLKGQQRFHRRDGSTFSADFV